MIFKPVISIPLSRMSKVFVKTLKYTMLRLLDMPRRILNPFPAIANGEDFERNVDLVNSEISIKVIP